jgi:hypothetical protein
MSCTAENYYEVMMEAQAAKLAERDVLVANEEKPETILASSFTVRHFDNSFVATA